jgi:hypothetical protein
MIKQFREAFGRPTCYVTPLNKHYTLYIYKFELCIIVLKNLDSDQI